MSLAFDGASLKLARVFSAMALEEVASLVGKTRQYVHKLETGQSAPTETLIISLAEALNVEPEFFQSRVNRLHEDQFHFRKLLSTTKTTKQVAVARGEVVHSLIGYLEKQLRLPSVNIPSIPDIHSHDCIERAAESCRKEWELGLGPVDNMTRLAENLGAVVLSFEGLTKEIDALSVAVERPFIVRNNAKESTSRYRFDIAHELGHLVMHEGVVTGDRVTENQANRFASAFLLPRSMMIKFFPRPNGTRLDWKGIREFKGNWKVSKGAILYRARQLEIITDAQYKTGVITLKRQEGTREKDDYLIPEEPPEVLLKSLTLLASKKGLSEEQLAKALNVKPAFLRELLGSSTLAPLQQVTKQARHLRVIK